MATIVPTEIPRRRVVKHKPKAERCTLYLTLFVVISFSLYVEGDDRLGPALAWPLLLISMLVTIVLIALSVFFSIYEPGVDQIREYSGEGPIVH